jgi:hypothetical protein
MLLGIYGSESDEVAPFAPFLYTLSSLERRGKALSDGRKTDGATPQLRKSRKSCPS